MGHLTALSGRQGTWRVAGHTASFGILLAIIADGSMCCLMSGGHATSDIDWYQWAGNICHVDFSISRAESVLSWSAGWWFWSVRRWFNDFSGRSVMLTKIKRFQAPKIRYWENHRGQTTWNGKITQKKGLLGQIRQPRSPWSPATMGFLSPFGRCFPPFFGLFLFFFLLYFSWHSSPCIWLDFPEENSTRSRANQSTKFPIF